MAMTALVVRLRTVSGEFESGLKQANKRSRSFGRRIEKSIGGSMRRAAQSFSESAQSMARAFGGPLGSALDGFLGQLGSLKSSFALLGSAGAGLIGGIVAGVGAIAVAFGAAGAAAGVAAAGMIEEQRRLAERVGVTVEEFSSLAAVSKRFGLDGEAVADILSEVQQKAVNLTKDFEAFGIRVKDNSGRFLSQSQILANLADRIQSAETATEQMAIADDLLNDNGRKLLPVLRMGSEGIARLTAEAERNGAVISGAQADAAKDFTETWREVGRIITELTRNFGSAFIPVLTDLGETIVAVLKPARALASWIGDLGLAREDEAAGIQSQTLPALRAETEQRQQAASATRAQAAAVQDTVDARLEADAKLSAALELAQRRGRRAQAEAIRDIQKRRQLLVEDLRKLQTGGLIAQLAVGRTEEAIEADIAALNAAAEVVLKAERDAADRVIKQRRQIREQVQTLTPTATFRDLSLLPNGGASISFEMQQAPPLGPWQQYTQQIRTTTQQMAQLGAATTQSIGRNVSSVFQDAVSGARSFHESVRNAAVAIGADLVGALVSYGVQLAIVEAIGQSAAAKGIAAAAANGAAVTAAVAPQAASLAALWGPAAIAASIASFGGASAVGLSSYLAALASGTAATTAAQAASGLLGALTGGLQGSAAGGLTSVPETGTYRLHRGERVLSPEQNRDLVKAMRGGMGGGSVVVENRSGGRVRTEERGDSMRVIVEAAAELVGRRFERQARKRRGQMFRALELDAAGRA